MTKRTVQGLAWMLLAAPLVLVGCSDSGDKDGGTGGAGGMKSDGGGGAGGSNLDGGPVADTKPPTLDSQPGIDTVVVDAPAQPDAPAILDGGQMLDVSLVDTKPQAIDSAPVIDTAPAIDATPAIDTTPVVATCTESKKWTGGDVKIDRTLTKACSPYSITSDINIISNSTLTIEAGVTLEMANDVEISVGYGSAGKLVANGTATNPIVFTSPTAGAGDWAGIHFWGNTITGSSISYAKVDYCGQGRACIHGEGGVKTGRVTVDHVTIDHVGPNTNAITEKDTDSNFAISNCTFKGIPAAQYAISVNAESFAGIDSTNAFNGSAIELRGGDITASATWKNPGTSVVVVVTADLSVDGAPAPTLTIAAGTQLSFVQETGIDVGYSRGGTLKLAGTATAPVTLTSANTPAAAGDWNGIFVWGNGQAVIDYANISYGGNIATGSASGDICVDGKAKLTISNSKLSDSSGYGIWIRCASDATITEDNVTYAATNVSGDKGPGPSPTGLECL